jgi:hypothetical protein
MKKIIYKAKYLFLSAIVLVGCTDNFEEINTDPNNPTVVPTAYLITNAQRGIVTQQYYFTTSLYAQFWSDTQYTNTSRYETAESSFNAYYSSPLKDLQQVIDLNTNEDTKGDASASGSNENQIAVAKILQVLTFQYITDMWGEIPYSQALAGVENFTPAYDTQDVIYADFVTSLTDAANMIDVNAAGIEGDIIYGGDMAKWKMFANALKMRVGIRMTNSDPTAAAAAISTGNAGAFAGPGDQALYYYLEDAANDNPMWAHFITRTDYAASNTLVDFMNARTDPRLPIYADPATGTGVITGMPYGVSEAIAGSITNASISFPGAATMEATTPGLLMTYSEQLFIQAEAIQRGFLPGGDAAAATAYEAAITANMLYWDVDAADIAPYIAQASVAYDAANFEQLIGEQKWLSLYTNGTEAWAEWRRLDWPALLPAPDAVENREIPRRRAYTQDEYDLNEINVTEAVARQGADDMATRMWWDK